MKKEKIILTFIFLIIGLAVLIGCFFIYESTRKVKPTELKTITVENPTPSPISGIFLTIDSPKDESVVDNRTITISGKTTPDAKIVILTENNQVGAIPSNDGSFNSDITLSPNENIIEISAISPNGEIVKVKRVVSYSTESF